MKIIYNKNNSNINIMVKEFYKNINCENNIKCLFIIDTISKKCYEKMIQLVNKNDKLHIICCAQNIDLYSDTKKIFFCNNYEDLIEHSNIIIQDKLETKIRSSIENSNKLYFKNINSLESPKLYIAKRCSLYSQSGYCVRTDELLNNMEDYIITLNPLLNSNKKYINNINKIHNERNLLLLTIVNIIKWIKLLNIKEVILPSNCENFLLIYNYFNKIKLKLNYTYDMRGLWFLSKLSKYNYHIENNIPINDNIIKEIKTDCVLEIYSMNNANNIIFITDEQKKYCIDKLKINIKDKKTIVLYNCANINNKIDYKPNKIGYFIIGYFGSITCYEGINNLIKVVENLNKKYKVKLLLIGRTTVNIKCNKHFIYIRWLDKKQLLKYYNKIDLFCIPRLPYKVCELISPIKPFNILYNKIPLLMSDCDTLKSISNNGKNCMLFKKGNNNDLYNKIEEIINNGYNKELLENGYNFIINERTWDIQQKKLNKLFTPLES